MYPFAVPANALTLRWLAKAADDRSTVISGASVWPLLAYLAAGAGGPAREELSGAVGLDVAEAVAAATLMRQGISRSDAVRMGVAAWFDRRVPVSDRWVRTVGADVRGSLSGDPAADQAALDAWVAGVTDGLIRALPDVLSPGAVMALAAAVAVRTTWKQRFESSLLRPSEGPWAGRHLRAVERKSLDLDEVRVTATPIGPLTLVGVEGDGDVVVDLVLGPEDRTAGEVLAAGVRASTGAFAGRPGSVLTGDDRAPGLSVDAAAPIPGPMLRVTLPPWSIDADHDLCANAEVLGLGAAMTATTEGHFPKISSEVPLYVRAARQIATASFSETGFEAAAATAFGVALGLPPPPSIEVRFDRPFGFVAKLRSSGLILVAGWVADVDDT